MLIRIRTTLMAIPLKAKSITHIIMGMVIRIITEERLPIKFFKLPKNEHLDRQNTKHSDRRGENKSRKRSRETKEDELLQSFSVMCEEEDCFVVNIANFCTKIFLCKFEKEIEIFTRNVL